MPGRACLIAVARRQLAQVYLWAARNGAGPEAIGPTRATFDHVVAHQPRVSLAFYVAREGYHAAECQVRWCWCDALFMAPPAMLALSSQTDERKLFWPRGNGWVFAGMARSLPWLADGTDRRRLVALFREMADRPEQVLPTDTQYCWVGGFLLAASEVARLDQTARR